MVDFLLPESDRDHVRFFPLPTSFFGSKTDKPTFLTL
jgi:hypothetical protein